MRQSESKPKAEAFKVWAETTLTQQPKKSDLRVAFQYGLNRWAALTLFLDDDRVALDNNAAERALRPIGVGRRNRLFAGADTGGETLACAMTLIETAKMNGLDPQAYLANIRSWPGGVRAFLNEQGSHPKIIEHICRNKTG